MEMMLAEIPPAAADPGSVRHRLDGSMVPGETPWPLLTRDQ
jgi:hypothetical protein